MIHSNRDNHAVGDENKTDIQPPRADARHYEKTGQAISDLFSEENRKKVVDAVSTIFDENARKKVRDTVTTIFNEDTKKKIADAATDFGNDVQRQVNKIEDYATPLVKEAGKKVENIWASIKKIKF